MGCLALADIPDFRDSPLGAHPPHINVDGWKGLLAWPSSSQSLSGVGGQAFSTGPLAPSLCPALALVLPVSAHSGSGRR